MKKKLPMRVGIDFDNTIACYDNVFCELARSWQLVNPCFDGNKRELRDLIFTQIDGELIWQRLQGKAYGEWIDRADSFQGFTEFLTKCRHDPDVELFIVSHKTTFGHFDEKKINLQDAARRWLHTQGFIHQNGNAIKEDNVFFELTRENKIHRIHALQCTHFIDDLIEILDSPLFPMNTQRILFQPACFDQSQNNEQNKSPSRIGSPWQNHSNWTSIKNALFS